MRIYSKVHHIDGKERYWPENLMRKARLVTTGV